MRRTLRFRQTPIGVVNTLPVASPHWMWVNDFVFPHMSDGQALLVDGDTGAFLGQLSTGFAFLAHQRFARRQGHLLT